MDIVIREETAASLAAYAAVPIAFEIRAIADPVPDATTPSGYALRERPVATGKEKDYDAVAGEGPQSWPARFDVSRWGFLGAFVEEIRVGSAAVAFDTSSVAKLEGRRDLAVLWDLRVAPSHRGRGVGAALVAAAEAWARDRGCRRLDVETQNVNVPACRFYARRGFSLRFVVPGAYREFPDEIQLLWSKPLEGVGGVG